MAVLSGGELLDLWERADGLDPARRALALAAAADPLTTTRELEQLPVGQRDARLLGLRVAMAGPLLEATAVCPACAEQVEFALDALALLDASALLDAAGTDASAHATVHDDVSVTWRCPTTADLAVIADLAEGGTDGATVEAALLDRCILDVAGAPDAGTGLPPAVRAAVVEAMGAADPLAEVVLDVACAHCGAGFSAEVDVAEFAWAEVRAAAHRLLWQVDVLARAYGWSEREVLELSEWRRGAYLELAMGHP